MFQTPVVFLLRPTEHEPLFTLFVMNNMKSFNSGTKVSASASVGRWFLLFVCGLVVAFDAHGAASNSIARVWMERALGAIRADTPHPPAQARNYFSFSVCMYDAWAAYDPVAVGYVYRGKHTAANIASARSNALSFAVYRMMKERHAFSRTAAATLLADDILMLSLGYNLNDQSRDTSTPTGVGNTIYDAVSLWFSDDGSRGTNGTPYNPAFPNTLPVAYPDYPLGHPRRYVFTNPALATDRAGIDDGFGNTVLDINRWQRLNVVNAVDQNGFPISPQQNYLGAQWLWVRPFSLTRTDENKPWIDPGPPPFFGGPTHAAFVKEIVEVIRASSQLTTNNDVMIDISPGVYGNNSLSMTPAEYEWPHIYDGHGHTNNPVTGLPYEPNVVKLGDYARVLAEFWADGPNSETPPGHWNVVANDMSDNPLLQKRIGGTGPVVDDLEWDVKLYLALNAATHDAAVACWSIKRYYDGWRPMSPIRFLGGLGQSSNPAAPSYNANGLPLITNLIELVTLDSRLSGRHAGLTPGKIAVLAWPGETPQRVVPNGVRWLHADTWTTYQRSNFVVPAFPGYSSGHSTFSRSAAEILTAFTGSPYFPGGIHTYTISNLANEKGPSRPIELRYATYYDAADGAGLSRIWGGIHPNADNMGGRIVGAQVGTGVWDLVKRYWNGSVINHSPVANDDSATTPQGVPVTVSVLANDTDPDEGDVLSITSVTAPAHGSAVITTNQTVVYSPDPAYSGADSFSYAIGDGRDGMAQATVRITVTPQPPTMTCPVNITAECTGGNTPVTFTATAVDASGASLAVACTPPSGSGFPTGISSVSCSATDSAGQSSSCSFTVTVMDTIAPAVNCPANTTVSATSNAGAAVTYDASASDSCGLGSFSCSPPSGSTFPVGTTTVTCTAADAGGRSSSCNFTVTVNAQPPTAVISTDQLVNLGADFEHPILISCNWWNACLIADGRSSTGTEPLTYLWFADQDPVPFGAGPVVTNCLEVGVHTITLAVTDARGLRGTDSKTLEVMTAPLGIELLIEEITSGSLKSAIPRKTKRELTATLRVALDFSKNNRLRETQKAMDAFEKKVRALVAPNYPVEATKWIRWSQAVSEGMEKCIKPPRKPKHDDDGKKTAAK